MARAFVGDGRAVRAGVIAAPPPAAGDRTPPRGFEAFAASHPSPNAASAAAGMRALELARESARANGQLVVLLSGGASALLAAPVDGVTLDEKIATAHTVMRAGVAIDGLNCVRKHLSLVKGGRLAAAAASTLTLAISDVHGPIADDPSVIGSGPTVADPTTFAQALEIVRHMDGVPLAVRRHLERGARGEAVETPKPGDSHLTRGVYAVIGNRQTALDGAARAARACGYAVHLIPAPVDGEAREAARRFVAEARRALDATGRSPAGACILAAGETTVTVTGSGRGGRNQEFVLAAVPDLPALGRAVLASAGTDGIDGPTDAAGAVADSTTDERARRIGLDRESTLAANDAYHFFRPLGDLVVWGPTGTNVGDVQVLLVA
jgi:hydroxypyruvate reductase